MQGCPDPVSTQISASDIQDCEATTASEAGEGTSRTGWAVLCVVFPGAGRKVSVPIRLQSSSLLSLSAQEAESISEMCVVGSWDGWRERHTLHLCPSTHSHNGSGHGKEWAGVLTVAAGTYHFKFVADGKVSELVRLLVCGQAAGSRRCVDTRMC